MAAYIPATVLKEECFAQGVRKESLTRSSELMPFRFSYVIISHLKRINEIIETGRHERRTTKERFPTSILSIELDSLHAGVHRSTLRSHTRYRAGTQFVLSAAHW